MKKTLLYSAILSLLAVSLALGACSKSEGAKLFSTNCTKYHGKPSTKMTQTELEAFIPRHAPANTTLTTAQVEAIAS